MPTPKGKKVVTVYVDEDLRADIIKLAKLNDQSANSYTVTLYKNAVKAAKKKGLLDAVADELGVSR